MVVSWSRGPRLSWPSPGERSRPAVLDMESPRASAEQEQLLALELLGVKCTGVAQSDEAFEVGDAGRPGDRCAGGPPARAARPLATAAGQSLCPASAHRLPGLLRELAPGLAAKGLDPGDEE